MEKNEVIMVLEDVAGDKKFDFISGTINNPGLSSCSLTDKRGAVYGFAVKLEDKEVAGFLKQCDNKNINKNKWIALGNSYYPLYWGKDKNIGTRLHAHTKSHKKNASIQINNREFLMDKEIIYGAILCMDCVKIEKRLKEKFPDVLMTKMNK